MIETEIKLRVRDSAVRAQIEALGYHIYSPRELESDQLYDRADGSLREADQVLRLRTRGARSTLTFKGPAQKRTLYKTREEIELDVTDGAAFALVLHRLGYQPSFRYEKFRTTYAADTQLGIITLDETPAGDFLELEGDADWIDRTALNLGYSPAEYITGSYARLWREYCETNPGAVPSAMVF